MSKNVWCKSSLGDCLEIDFDKMQYEAVISKCGNISYDLTINLDNENLFFHSTAYCKTIKQAKELEARIRLTLMEVYL